VSLTDALQVDVAPRSVGSHQSLGKTSRARVSICSSQSS
jgi:hypothetical protein